MVPRGDKFRTSEDEEDGRLEARTTLAKLRELRTPRVAKWLKETKEERAQALAQRKRSNQASARGDAMMYPTKADLRTGDRPEPARRTAGAWPWARTATRARPAQRRPVEGP